VPINFLTCQKLLAQTCASLPFCIDSNQFTQWFYDKFGQSLTLSEIAALHLTDLCLAFACVTYNKDALLIFEKQYIPDLEKTLWQLRMGPEVQHDILQDLREKLFVGGLKQAKLMTYSGAGSLKSWLKTVCIRICFHHFRDKKVKMECPTEEEALLSLLNTDSPQKLDFGLQVRQFIQFFSASFAQLEQKERTLIRYYYLYGFSIDKIGLLWGIHRVTALRQCEAAKLKLIAVFKQTLKASISISEQSLLRLDRLLEDDSCIMLLLGQTQESNSTGL